MSLFFWKKKEDVVARKVIGLIPSLLERGFITNQGSIEERRKRYKMASNPFPLFLKDCCIIAYS